MTEIEALLELVKLHPAGPIDRQTDVGAKVFGGLVDAWPNLPGSSDQSTFAEKLRRVEDLHWSPPLITFRLERHGGTVQGSTRADIHYWTIDLVKEEAWIGHHSYKQIRPTDTRLDCAALARDIAAAIESGDKCAGLVWDDEMQSVTIKIGELIPETVQSTTTGRRKRFRKALLPLMAEQGWEFRPKGNLMRFSHPQSIAD